MQGIDGRAAGAVLESIIDQVKETQLKLGYADESVRLYYLASSMALLSRGEADGEEIGEGAAGGATRDARDDTAEGEGDGAAGGAPGNAAGGAAGDASGSATGDPAGDAAGAEADARELAAELSANPGLRGTPLGDLSIEAVAGNRICIRVPRDGVRYVHEQVPAPPFLAELVALFEENHHCTRSDIESLFARFGAHACTDMPEDAGFDYMMRFDDPSVDRYLYCFKEEMGHTIYHRFTEADFLLRWPIPYSAAKSGVE